MTEQTSTSPVIPSILTANTYFWAPGSSASHRRNNEARHNAEVERFIQANQAALEAAGVVINFSYSESCHNVYKHCEITRNGKRSNITAVRKALGLA
jgi:hypothetical protein